MSDSSSSDLTVQAWLENFPLEARIDQVRRLWYESVGVVTVLEKIMRSGDPSNELFAQYKAGIDKCRQWDDLLSALKANDVMSCQTGLAVWVDEYSIKSLPWKGGS
jgi:hypothetical protein